MAKLVTDAQTAYDVWKSGKDLTTMTESEMADYNIVDLKFQKAITDATEIETTFYAARTEAVGALETAYQEQRTALLNLWQLKENNGFDTTYTGA
jgi:hypothetical protein